MFFRLPLRERPPLAPERPPFADSFWLSAMAAVAVGMFVGTWVIGPAFSSDPIDHEPLRSAKAERQMLLAATGRPDPSPYRTPTPAFNMPDTPRYGMLAREQALAALGVRGERRDTTLAGYSDDAAPEPYDNSPWQSFAAPRSTSQRYYRRIDRASDVSNY